MIEIRYSVTLIARTGTVVEGDFAHPPRLGFAAPMHIVMAGLRLGYLFFFLAACER
jgi:hypothetical protein